MVLKCAFPLCPNHEKPTRKRKSALPMLQNEWLNFHTFPSNDRERHLLSFRACVVAFS
ncbi:hypothetical protein PO909_010253 [Leuciscus waleckii]